jgi:hypothetical protein
MRNPWFIEPSIAASTTKQSPGSFPLIRARTVSITVRLTCGAALNADPVVNVYYSPDAETFDTAAFATFTMARSAGNVIQATKQIDPPEHGFFAISIQNASAADVITAVKTWYSIQSWPGDR